MFWEQGAGPDGGLDLESIRAHCQAAWGVRPCVHHSYITFGGLEVRSKGSLDYRLSPAV